jgi:hypothetical protein
MGYRRKPIMGWEELEPRWCKPRAAPIAPVHRWLRESAVGPRPGRRRDPSDEAKSIVARMSGLGLSVSEISRLTGYRPSTLYRSFRPELDQSALSKDLDVLESAYWQAVGGPEKDWKRAEPSMTRFWLGQRVGWRAPTAYDKPRQQVIDLDRLSDEELHELDRLLGRAGDAG